MNTTVLIAIGIALLIIVKLAFVAFHLWKKVWQQQADQELATENAVKKRQESQAYIIESIQVICKTLINEEMNLSEGAIRLKVLADNLNFSDEERSKFKAIESLYELVSALDTHEARKELPKKDRMRQDLQREKAETKYQQQFMSDVNVMLELANEKKL